MTTVLDRTAIVAQVDQPERLAELKVRAMDRFSELLARISPEYLKDKWAAGELEHGPLTDIFSINTENELMQEAADLFWYSAIEDAQHG